MSLHREQLTDQFAACVILGAVTRRKDAGRAIANRLR